MERQSLEPRLGWRDKLGTKVRMERDKAIELGLALVQ